MSAGCSLAPPYIPDPRHLDQGALPEPNVAVNISNLGPCTDSSDRTVRFNSNHPIAILVHGCKGSAGRFRTLAQLYAFHGQQAVCYSYDDRDSLVDIADQLILDLDTLSKHTNNQALTVIGHSMGGLITRKAFEIDRPNSLSQDRADIRLATVSAPLAGIRDAKTCGYKSLQWLSLGILPGLCWMVSGDNWSEITAQSKFIREPKPLHPSVSQYLKVVTDEKDTCRQRDPEGRCIQSDYVFALDEQYHSVIDSYSRMTNVVVEAGHVEIVGYKDVAPRKLLSILQQNGLMASTPPERLSAFELLLSKLY
jgi:hypothetical protein